MPRRAIDPGLADIMAPVDELPEKILAYLKRMPPFAQPEVALNDETQTARHRNVTGLGSHAAISRRYRDIAQL
jgi:hypothetical protein